MTPSLPSILWNQTKQLNPTLCTECEREVQYQASRQLGTCHLMRPLLRNQVSRLFQGSELVHQGSLGEPRGADVRAVPASLQLFVRQLQFQADGTHLVLPDHEAHLPVKTTLHPLAVRVHLGRVRDLQDATASRKDGGSLERGRVEPETVVVSEAHPTNMVPAAWLLLQ